MLGIWLIMTLASIFSCAASRAEAEEPRLERDWAKTVSAHVSAHTKHTLVLKLILDSLSG